LHSFLSKMQGQHPCKGVPASLALAFICLAPALLAFCVGSPSPTSFSPLCPKLVPRASPHLSVACCAMQHPHAAAWVYRILRMRACACLAAAAVVGSAAVFRGEPLFQVSVLCGTQQAGY
jgi:hypothetical protein